MFIKCDQHYQTYKLKSPQRHTTIRELTLSLHLLARSLALLRLSSSPYMRACLLPRLVCVFIQNLPGWRGIAVYFD